MSADPAADPPIVDELRLSTEAATDAQALDRLANVADQLGESAMAADIRQLATRVHEGRFFVACVGQFKRGKSTLLNALAGEAILPTGVVPVTAVPTVLRYGATRSARVLIDSEWRSIPTADLAQYVSEELNPENSKRLSGVEVFLPSPFLASGMCLVDTPGIGSVFAGNTEAVKDFIPQIDAAILVVGADPPISGEELALIEAVAANVDEIVIVLNKIDRVSLADRKEASAFAGKILQARLKKPLRRIYEVCALSRLTAPNAGDDWTALVSDLNALAAGFGQAMTRSAAERGLRRFSASMRRSIAERSRALRQPIAASEQRMVTLRATLNEAEQSLRDLGSLFSAEQLRLSNALLARRKEFLRSTLPQARRELALECNQVSTVFGPARRRQMLAQAQAVARRHVMPWLDSEETQAEELYGAVTQRFVNLVNGLLQRIAETQSDCFSHLPKSLEAERGFRIRSRFYFQDMIGIAQPASPLLYLSDLLLGILGVRYFFRKFADNFLELLMDTNAARVQGDVEQRVVESRQRLESEDRKLLREVSTSAEQALTTARALIEAGSNAVQNELERLEALQQQIGEWPGQPNT
jgi:Dynamin family